jgi:hypothetical protein
MLKICLLVKTEPLRLIHGQFTDGEKLTGSLTA